MWEKIPKKITLAVQFFLMTFSTVTWASTFDDIPWGGNQILYKHDNNFLIKNAKNLLKNSRRMWKGKMGNTEWSNIYKDLRRAQYFCFLVDTTNRDDLYYRIH